MSKEAVAFTVASLVTHFKAQTDLVFDGHIPESLLLDDLSANDKNALEIAARQAQEWMAGYSLTGPGGGKELIDATFALFGDLVRAYIQAEYPQKT